MPTPNTMRDAMNIDYNRLSVESLRELLRFHQPRQVIRHFEARGYSLTEIEAKWRKMTGRVKVASASVPAHDSTPTSEAVPW
jgi:hypothetical protein